jgi:hypothetical protein
MLLVGNAFRWKYTREIPAADGSKTKFGFDDWFFSREPNHMTAHASLTKLGVEFAPSTPCTSACAHSKWSRSSARLWRADNDLEAGLRRTACETRYQTFLRNHLSVKAGLVSARHVSGASSQFLDDRG